MFKRILNIVLIIGAPLALILYATLPAHAVLPNIFATQPAGNVAASLLDTNFTFLESQGVQALTTTGSSNAYVATPADAWLTGYSSYVGRALTIKPSFTNTGAATVNVSGLGTISIYKNVGGVQTALASGDIVSGSPAILISDGTGFLLANPTSIPVTGSGVAKAWVYFSTSGGVATINKAFNITSVTRTSTGKYTIAFTTAMADANYVVEATCVSQSGSFTAIVPSDSDPNTTANAFLKGLVPTSSPSTTVDIQQGYVIFFD